MTRRLRSIACLTAAAAAAACIDVTVNTAELGSVEVVNRGAPAVAAGDTLRDPAGVAVPLQVIVYDAGGNVITDRHVQFLHSDTVATVTAEGMVIARAGVTGTARVYAVVDSQLQSVVQQIEVVPRPESLAVSGNVVRDTIDYRSLPADPTDTSAALTVRLASAGTVNVARWIVTFALQRTADGSAITDTTIFALVTDQGRVSTVDTTDANGLASRRVRIRAIPGTTLVDSVTVVANALYRGQPVTGSPKQFFVLARPRPATP